MLSLHSFWDKVEQCIVCSSGRKCNALHIILLLYYYDYDYCETNDYFYGLICVDSTVLLLSSP